MRAVRQLDIREAASVAQRSPPLVHLSAQGGLPLVSDCLAAMGLSPAPAANLLPSHP